MADTDAKLGELIVAHRRVTSDGKPLVVGLTGGDLWRTVGGPSAVGRLYTPEAMHLPIDFVRAELDGHPVWFVAHLVATRGRSRVHALNGDWWRKYQLGPRAHPNDGLLDVYEASLGPRDLLKVSRRARLGSHLPHPAIRERRATRLEITFTKPHRIVLDGRRLPRRCLHLELVVEPDGAVIVV